MERPPTRRGSVQLDLAAPRSADSPGPSTTLAAATMDRPPTRNERLLTAATYKRPTSRMGTSQANIENTNTSRMSTAGRPPTGSDPAGRLSTARPFSRAGNLNQLPPRTPTAFTGAKDRPTTQQGLGGLKSAYRGPQRQIQDKSYFQAVLRSKMAEISGEIAKMNSEMDTYDRESSAVQLLEKQVKEMAIQITEFQGESADWNLLQEKISTSSDLRVIEDEIKNLQQQSERDSRDLELLYADVKQKKEQLGSVERDLQLELHRADELVATLDPEEQAKYESFKLQSSQLSAQIETLSQEIQALESRAAGGEQEIQLWPAKLEMYRLKRTLLELEEKRSALRGNEQGVEDPEDEKARLVSSLRRDNAELAAIEQQINETQSAIDRLQDDISDDNKSLDDSYKERSQKYRDLLKREQVMDEFLNHYEVNRDQETRRIEEGEQKVVAILKQLSKQEIGIRNLPSISDYNTTKEDLFFKETELKKSRATLEGLGEEHVRLQISIKKLDALETKITEELHTLKDSLQSMAEASPRYSDLAELRRQVEQKRIGILEQQQQLLEEKMKLQKLVEDQQFQCDELQAQLDSNETHVQLFALERKLRAIEENNQSAKEFIEKEGISATFDDVRQNVLNKVSAYQKTLAERYHKI